MGLSCDRLERRLQQAQTVLAARNDALDARGVPPESRERDPKWRACKAECRHLEGRLRAVSALAAREDERSRRKAEQPSE